MSFNPDPTKQAVEVLFSCKNISPDHPPLYFNGVEVERVSEHEHLGLTLDSKLTFVTHINEKISTARKWIGVIKHLSSYLPLKSLDQIYKMHIRPHLDYCDIIFHIPVITNDFDSSLTLNYQMNALEKTQYQAALAVSGAWKGTNRDKIYEELGWETLDHRRFFRRLTQFYKIINKLTPEYLHHSIPSGNVGPRSTNVLRAIPCRTDRYKKSFYPDTVSSWNNIGPELRDAQSLSIFKKYILKIIRPVKNDIFNIFNPSCIKWIFQLRVGLSPLKSHKKRHNFADTPFDTCPCTLNAETTQHFLLECPNYNEHRQELLEPVDSILLLNDMDNITVNTKVHLLLYGHKKLNFHENRVILKATIKYINKTGRFSQMFLA